ncbi:hypothetical protein BDC45DRAFT_570797 [Circinella umbellata]|nr:hypothetical protein BDC45DRAFT_570797 [Circinella umbellata]
MKKELHGQSLPSPNPLVDESSLEWFSIHDSRCGNTSYEMDIDVYEEIMDVSGSPDIIVTPGQSSISPPWSSSLLLPSLLKHATNNTPRSMDSKNLSKKNRRKRERKKTHRKLVAKIRRKMVNEVKIPK